jgi:hypothetical protein
VLGVLLSCSLVGTASAGTRNAAARYAVGSPGLSLAQSIAVAHWGWNPCGGNVVLTWKRQADDINALSLWSTLGADAYADPADNQDCEIDLNPAATWDWPKLCTVVVHEYGHLTGHDHDAHPGRLMSAVYSTPLPECTTTAEPRARTSRAPATALRAR